MTAIHLALVIATLLVVAYSDEQGLLWFLGKKQHLDAALVERLHLIVTLGLAGVVTTGGLLFIDRADYLLSNPVFIVKMVLVAALIVNGYFIGKTSALASTLPYAGLDSRQRRTVLVGAGISGIGWVGALICGLLL